MKILIAPDKFKGAQTARQAGENIAAGLAELSDVEIEIVPIADGGEGTAETIREARNGTWRQCQAHDASGQPMAARYVWLKETATAVFDMSEVAGFGRRQGPDPDLASTFGVGEMIREAARQGAREIVIGLGGSATNDGGFGMARALGFKFFSGSGELSGRVTELRNLTAIAPPPALQLPRITAAADVRNPLLGSNGATEIFGPQKGVTEKQIPIFETALKRLADVAAETCGKDYRDSEGAGAAGGLGFALLTFAQATMRSGFEVVVEAVGLEKKIRDADVVVTGEGKLDRQTLDGKGPAEVAKMARRFGKPVIAIVGLLEEGPQLRELFDEIYAVGRSEFSALENVEHAPELLREGGRWLAQSLKKRVNG